VGDPPSAEGEAWASREANPILGWADGSWVVAVVHHATVEGSLAGVALGVQNLEE